MFTLIFFLLRILLIFPPSLFHGNLFPNEVKKTIFLEDVTESLNPTPGPAQSFSALSPRARQGVCNCWARMQTTSTGYLTGSEANRIINVGVTSLKAGMITHFSSLKFPFHGFSTVYLKKKWS